jgi:hypothetical protein
MALFLKYLPSGLVDKADAESGKYWKSFYKPAVAGCSFSLVVVVAFTFLYVH